MNAQFKFGVKKILHLPNGRSLVCHPLALKAAYDAQLRDPEQAAEFQQFLSYCHKGMHLFDVGASYGIFSLAAADLGGRAIAVEPSPIAVKILCTQLRLNRLGDSVEVIAAAAGEAEGSIRMLSSGVFSDGYFRFVSGRRRTETTRTDVTTLDTLATKFGTPTHIKIDVEGYEGAVLLGARKLLAESSPVIFLEIHNEMVAASGGDPNFSLEELLRQGYKILSVYGNPISKREALSPPISRVIASRA